MDSNTYQAFFDTQQQQHQHKLFIDTSFGKSQDHASMINTAPVYSTPNSYAMYSDSSPALIPQSAVSNSRRLSSGSLKSNQAPRFVSQQEYSDLTTVDPSVRVSLVLNARTAGSFFMNSDTWTCYRRNYMRIMTTLNLIATADSDDTQQHNANSELIFCNGSRVVSYLVRVSGNSAGRPVDLTMHTIKKHRVPNAVPLPRPIVPGGDMSDPAPPKTPLTPRGLSSPSSDGGGHQFSFNASYVRKPSSAQHIENCQMLSFDRVQFRQATSNNGKRKTIQEYFRLQVDLYAVLEDGNEVKIADTLSEEIVVRGRSPGHYAQMEAVRESESFVVPESPRKRTVSDPYGSRNSYSTNDLLSPGVPYSSYVSSIPVVDTDFGNNNWSIQPYQETMSATVITDSFAQHMMLNSASTSGLTPKTQNHRPQIKNRKRSVTTAGRIGSRPRGFDWNFEWPESTTPYASSATSLSSPNNLSPMMPQPQHSVNELMWNTGNVEMSAASSDEILERWMSNGVLFSADESNQNQSPGKLLTQTKLSSEDAVFQSLSSPLYPSAPCNTPISPEAEHHPELTGFY